MGQLFGFNQVSSSEINALMIMARVMYDAVSGDIDENQDGQDEWENITGGLSVNSRFLGASNSRYEIGNEFDSLQNFGETSVYELRESGSRTIAVAIKGTDEIPADIPRWSTVLIESEENENIIREIFDPLMTPLIAYIDDSNNNVDKILFTGHSIGASLAERLMEIYFEGRSDVSGVTFASPSRLSDSRILHIGFENDGVYGLEDAPTNSATRTSGLRVWANEMVPQFLGAPLLVHDPQFYTEAIEVVSNSLFANTDARDDFQTNVLVALPTELQELIELPDLMELDSYVLVSLNSDSTASPSALRRIYEFVLAGDDYGVDVDNQPSSQYFEGGEQNDKFSAFLDGPSVNDDDILFGQGGDDE